MLQKANIPHVSICTRLQYIIPIGVILVLSGCGDADNRDTAEEIVQSGPKTVQPAQIVRDREVGLRKPRPRYASDLKARKDEDRKRASRRDGDWRADREHIARRDTRYPDEYERGLSDSKYLAKRPAYAVDDYRYDDDWRSGRPFRRDPDIPRYRSDSDWPKRRLAPQRRTDQPRYRDQDSYQRRYRPWGEIPSDTRRQDRPRDRYNQRPVRRGITPPAYYVQPGYSPYGAWNQPYMAAPYGPANPTYGGFGGPWSGAPGMFGITPWFD